MAAPPTLMASVPSWVRSFVRSGGSLAPRGRIEPPTLRFFRSKRRLARDAPQRDRPGSEGPSSRGHRLCVADLAPETSCLEKSISGDGDQA
jgi:hypothetical protein